MNIFYLHEDPVICAQYHNDKHVTKMVIEYAQLLSTAHRVLDGTVTIGVSKTGRKQTRIVLSDVRESILYNATHVNHPSTKWCRASSANYMWLYNLFCAVCDEYTYRYGKIHLTDQKLRNILATLPQNIDKAHSFIAPWRAMPDDVKIGNDSLLSYRNYYIKNKAHLARWKKRNVPEWLDANL